ncbi:MAG: NADPH:quinone reductase [Armatimonadetes bacterium]|nr:NADPH:quinone reductase [Armatimonadota bacterium]
MKAIRVHEFGDPEVMKLGETSDLSPGPGEVVVRVHAAGVNPVDTYIRTGKYARKPDLPYTPGIDAAGVVQAVGEGVTRVSQGDRVYTAWTLTGTYAEQVLCKASQVHPLPDHVTFAQGSAIHVPYATAYRALFHRARAVAGETVLIHGASGGVGIGAVQLARAAGLRVLGSAGTDKGKALVAEQGAHHVVDHHDPGYLDQLRELTGGKGVDVILEMLANVNLNNDLNALAMGGRIVVIGCRGTVEIDPRGAMSRDAAVLGVVLFNTPEDQMAGIHAALVAGLENKSLRPVINQELPLVEAPQAHVAVMESGAYGKIVLTP